jgi:hypothetical protein
MGMDVYGRKPKNKSGEYFRANCWSWRPIHWLCYVAKNRHEEVTGYDDLISERIMVGMSENSGYGLRSERKCKLLSDYLQDFVDEISDPKEIPFEEECKDGFKWGVYENGQFYIDIGTYESCLDENTFNFLSEDECKDPNIEKYSAYRTNKEHIQGFCDFLKDCGGFRVW